MTRRKTGGRDFTEGNPGRPKGARNKTTAEVRTLALSIVGEPGYLKKLKARIASGKAQKIEELLWHYAFGKPKEQVEHRGEDGGPIKLNLRVNFIKGLDQNEARGDD